MCVVHVVYNLFSSFHLCIISVYMYATHMVEEIKQSMICAAWKHSMFCAARGCWSWCIMPFHSYLLSSFTFSSNKLIRNKKSPCSKYAIVWRLQVHHQKEKEFMDTWLTWFISVVKSLKWTETGGLAQFLGPSCSLQTLPRI